MTRLSEEIEQDFELVGSTAIEDCLQDEVGQTIKDIKSIGIKVWVLTGDKVETAINIGYSCMLLNDEMNIFILREKKTKKIVEEIAKCYSQQKVSYKARENAVIVEGETLTKI